MVEPEHLNAYKEYNHLGLSKGTWQHADGVIIGSGEIDRISSKFLKSQGKPVLEFTQEEYLDKYAEFGNLAPIIQNKSVIGRMNKAVFLLIGGLVY